MSTKIKSWKAIAVIASLALGFITWAISEYRPTAEGQINWERASYFFFAVFVGAIVYAFIRYKRK